MLAELKTHLGPEREGELDEEGFYRFIRGYQSEEPRIPKTIEAMDKCLVCANRGLYRLISRGKPGLTFGAELEAFYARRRTLFFAPTAP